MSVAGVDGVDRWAAGLAVGGLTAAYWLAVARPLVALLVGSLVVAGERASAPGGHGGAIPSGAVPTVAAVELAVALQASLAGQLALGVVAGGLFLLATRLAGPVLAD